MSTNSWAPVGLGVLGGAVLVFAVLSLGAWVVLRRVVGVKEGQVKV